MVAILVYFKTNNQMEIIRFKKTLNSILNEFILKMQEPCLHKKKSCV